LTRIGIQHGAITVARLRTSSWPTSRQSRQSISSTFSSSLISNTCSRGDDTLGQGWCRCGCALLQSACHVIRMDAQHTTPHLADVRLVVELDAAARRRQLRVARLHLLPRRGIGRLPGSVQVHQHDRLSGASGAMSYDVDYEDARCYGDQAGIDWMRRLAGMRI
jgi:hypothetical protein